MHVCIYATSLVDIGVQRNIGRSQTSFARASAGIPHFSFGLADFHGKAHLSQEAATSNANSD